MGLHTNLPHQKSSGITRNAPQVELLAGASAGDSPTPNTRSKSTPWHFTFEIGMVLSDTKLFTPRTVL